MRSLGGFIGACAAPRAAADTGLFLGLQRAATATTELEPQSWGAAPGAGAPVRTATRRRAADANGHPTRGMHVQGAAGSMLRVPSDAVRGMARASLERQPLMTTTTPA